MKTETIAMTKQSVETLLDDIILDITWSKIARRYFDRSASWIYNKMNGKDSNGGEGGFTYGEKIQLRAALFDFAERVRTAAHAIDV